MTTNSRYSINPMALSFKELVKLLPSTLGKVIPQEGELKASGAEILFCHESANATITVYTNGFCLYQDAKGAHVLAVDRCRNIRNRDHDGNLIKVTRGEFDSGPCLIPLLISGEEGIEHDMDDYEIYWREFLDSQVTA